MKKLFIIPIEIELECDEEGLTNEGWETASCFQNVLDKLIYDYGWSEIKRVGMPRYKEEN